MHRCVTLPECPQQPARIQHGLQTFPFISCCCWLPKPARQCVCVHQIVEATAQHGSSTRWAQNEVMCIELDALCYVRGMVRSRFWIERLQICCLPGRKTVTSIKTNPYAAVAQQQAPSTNAFDSNCSVCMPFADEGPLSMPIPPLVNCWSFSALNTTLVSLFLIASLK